MAELGKMDSFEFNKMAGALLGTLLFTVAIVILGDAIFQHPKLVKAGYVLPSAEEAAGGTSAGAKPAPAEPLPVLLAKADVKKGEADTHPCQACHNFAKGAGIKIGPPLWGVVDRPKGSVAGFDYSGGMKAKGGKWTFEDLYKFIADPKAYVSGTKMTFAGYANPQERADVIAYLDTLSDHPVPLPKPEKASKAAPAAAKATAPAAQKQNKK